MAPLTFDVSDSAPKRLGPCIGKLIPVFSRILSRRPLSARRVERTSRPGTFRLPYLVPSLLSFRCSPTLPIAHDHFRRLRPASRPFCGIIIISTTTSPLARNCSTRH